MGIYKDLTGKKYYALTVLGRHGSNKHGVEWECKCDCGNTVYVNSNALNCGAKKSCGCQKFYKKNYDLTGQRFGRLLVLGEDGRKHTSGGNIRMLKCKCDCGNIVIKSRSHVLRGDIQSCGCLLRDISSARARHHLTNTRIHHCWSAMLARCGKLENYLDVSVCDEWKIFENFYEWSMKNGYRDDLTIDRIDPYGNYEPSNCRWANWKTQQNNKRNSKKYEIDGVFHTASEWADIYGVPYKLVKSRLRYDKDIKRALYKGTRKYVKVYVVETHTTYDSKRECARDMGLNETGIWRCMNGLIENYKGYHFKTVEG